MSDSAKSASAFEPVGRIAILGLGLLGGSIALAARRRGLAREVVGFARRPGPLEQAKSSGVIDDYSDLASVLRGAELVVVGTPVSAMARVLEDAAPHLEAGTIVTDVGSVKAVLVETLPGLLPAGVEYVGSHPMAGSHVVGVEFARDDLLENRTVVVTPSASTDAAACERVEAFWRGLGANVVRRDPETHDAEVAWTSHLPHVLAFAYARALAAAPSGAGELAASGFADFTRIAHSNPELWSDILAANGKGLAGPIQNLSNALASLARCIDAEDAEALERLLATARDTLAEVGSKSPSTRGAPERGDALSGGENLEIPANPKEGRPPKGSNN